MKTQTNTKDDLNHNAPGSSFIRILLQPSEGTIWEDLIRECLSGQGCYVIPCSSDPEQAISQAEDLSPCVLILSKNSLAQCSEELRSGIARVPGLRVIIAGDCDHEQREALLAAGVVGFLSNNASASVVVTVAKAVMAGEVWADRKTVSALLTKLVFQSNAQSLSDREIEILQCITDGLKNREIADHLCISRDTVRWHIRGLYTKIGAADRLSAVMYGRRFLVGRSARGESRLDADYQSATGALH